MQEGSASGLKHPTAGDFIQAIELCDEKRLDCLVSLYTDYPPPPAMPMYPPKLGYDLPCTLWDFLSQKPFWLARFDSDRYDDKTGAEEIDSAIDEILLPGCDYTADAIEEFETGRRRRISLLRATTLIEDDGCSLMDRAYNRRNIAQIKMILKVVSRLQGHAGALAPYLRMAVHDEIEEIVYLLLKSGAGLNYVLDRYQTVKSRDIRLMLDIASSSVGCNCGYEFNNQSKVWSHKDKSIHSAFPIPFREEYDEEFIEDRSVTEEWDEELGQQYPAEGY